MDGRTPPRSWLAGVRPHGPREPQPRVAHGNLKTMRRWLTSRRQLRVAEAVLLVLYAAWVAYVAGKTPANQLEDYAGLGSAFMNLQAVPSLLAALLALLDALLKGRVQSLALLTNLAVAGVTLAVLVALALFALVGIGPLLVPVAIEALLIVVVIRDIALQLTTRGV